MTLEKILMAWEEDEVEVILGVGIVISFAIIYAIDYFKKK